MFKESAENQIVKVFNFHPITKELIGPSDAWVVAHTGLPAHCTTNKPPVIKANQVAVYTDAGWQVVEDYRGAVIYDVATSARETVNVPGPIPEGKTRLAPTSEFDAWKGKKWVKDTAAEKASLINQAQQDKKQRMALASENISVLSYAKDSGQATPEEIALLTEWQDYRLQLSRVDVSATPDKAWPGEPANVA